MTQKFRTPFTQRYRVQVKCTCDEDKTLQSHKDDCNINKIIAHHDKTGLIRHVATANLEYTDAPNIDFHEAMNVVAEGKSQFELLPSGIRNKFENNIGKYMDFIHDPKNIEEATELGIFKKPQLKPEEKEAKSTEPPKPTEKTNPPKKEE